MPVLIALLLMGADASGIPEGFTPPKLIETVPVQYPAQARKRRISGMVRLHVLIDEKGKVVEVTVVKSPDPDLARAASEAVSKFTFEPARIKGRPVRVKIPMDIPFILRQNPRSTKGPEGRAPPGQDSPSSDASPSGAQAVRDATTVQKAAGLSDKNSIKSDSYAGNSSADASGTPSESGDTASSDTGTSASDSTSPFDATTASSDTKNSEEQTSDGQPEEIVVRSSRVKQGTTTYTITMDDALRLPGIQGDPLKAVQAMPGVARSPFGIGMLVVRGSSPRDTRYYIEGHNVPLIYHFLALTSVLNDNFLKSIDFLPGNFSPEFGRLSGGVVNVRLKRLKRRKHGEASADLWGVMGFWQQPVGSGVMAIALRRSYVDTLLRGLRSWVGLPIDMAPFYYDGQIMYERPLVGGLLTFMGFGSYDSLQLLSDGSEPYRTAFGKALALWKRTWDWGTVTASAASGPVSMRLEQEDQLSYGFDVWQNTMRLDVRAGAFHAGFDGEISSISGWFRLSGRGGDTDSESDPTDPFGNKDFTLDSLVTAAAIHGEYEMRWGRLSLVPGLRADLYHTEGYTLINLDPRLRTSWRLSQKWDLEGGVGLYTQEPEIQFMQEWLTHNQDIGWEHSLHTSAGIKGRWGRRAILRSTLFYKYIWDIITLSDAQADDGHRELFKNQGLGRAYGIEIMGKFALFHPNVPLVTKTSGWVSYTLMRAERKEDDKTDWHVYAYDQTHILTVFFTADLVGGWSLGLRFRYTTGNPFSPPEGSIYSGDTGTYVPVYGTERFTRRMDPFHQLDIRVDRTWTFETWKLSAYLDIQNTYNHRSSELVIYNFDYSRYDTVKGMPLFPSVGVKGVW